ncbi:hypothetical protein SAMN05892877_12191 [Rhizobium subbaraonis]|uniref:SAM-dependent methyltransferase n=1 Tax=Rhizobium subbaraonis TaxID=908946 RepID=A0A285UZW7_9HYPH|nr:SAM-dependent methyltransferase [Rhizobium subbaraonis]SOC46286.1 hypothetical protein SAMN05892877_12191 [Rhizobium subbaraonis]
MGTPKLSPDQTAILDAAIKGGHFRSETQAQRIKCRALNAKGLIRRDPKDGDVWYPAEGLKPVAAAEPAPEIAALPTVLPADASDLMATVQRARQLLDEGDVMAARRLAGGAYLEAKAAAQFAASFGADGRRLVEKARRLQADALLIETRAMIRIAEAYDAAQAAGDAATRGRPKNVSDENIFPFTLDEAGISRTQIHAARQLAKAERATPGIAERAIAARVAAGLEPSRANLKAAIGTKTATKEERGDNLYETHAVAVHTLAALEDFSPTVWEPACGRGAISRILEAAGYSVILSDLVDYGTADAHGEVQAVIDFRETKPGEGECHDIVTNPPYGEVLNSFVAHALRVHRPTKMALLLNLNFLAGFADDDRNFVMDELPPARVYVFKRRLPMMHRDGYEGPKASSSMNTAWFIWERQPDGTYGNATLVRRVDWKDYQPAAESEAAE